MEIVGNSWFADSRSSEVLEVTMGKRKAEQVEEEAVANDVEQVDQPDLKKKKKKNRWRDREANTLVLHGADAETKEAMIKNFMCRAEGIKKGNVVGIRKASKRKGPVVRVTFFVEFDTQSTRDAALKLSDDTEENKLMGKQVTLVACDVGKRAAPVLASETPRGDDKKVFVANDLKIDETDLDSRACISFKTLSKSIGKKVLKDYEAALKGKGVKNRSAYLMSLIKKHQQMRLGVDDIRELIRTSSKPRRSKKNRGVVDSKPRWNAFSDECVEQMRIHSSVHLKRTLSSFYKLENFDKIKDKDAKFLSLL
mmetsp:Transcript_34048/g.54475  ORF Transcript_34048/g.54475 Transcript_34048/m.54475 type:complete len:310 (+) Transcript_34048:265-1194(+)